MADVAAASRSIGEVINLLRDEFPELSVSKVRFLEGQGLIEPQRSASGYRMFSDDDIRRIQYILREQRDNFLPLKVIKSKINGWDRDQKTRVSAADQVPPETYFAGGNGVIPVDDFARTSGLSRAQVDELANAGLIEPTETPDGRTGFVQADLDVARAAAVLFGHGLEVRHLRTLRLAADRETDLLTQLATPYLRHRNPDSRRHAADILSATSQASVKLQEGIVRRRLKQLLDR